MQARTQKTKMNAALGCAAPQLRPDSHCLFLRFKKRKSMGAVFRYTMSLSVILAVCQSSVGYIRRTDLDSMVVWGIVVNYSPVRYNFIAILIQTTTEVKY